MNYAEYLIIFYGNLIIANVWLASGNVVFGTAFLILAAIIWILEKRNKMKTSTFVFIISALVMLSICMAISVWNECRETNSVLYCIKLVSK